MTSSDPTDNPGLREVRRIVEELEDDVREIRGTLEGSSLRGEGVMARLGSIEREQRDLKSVLKGFEDGEKQRAEEQKERQQKVDRRQAVLTGIVVTILTTVVGNLILLYLSGLIGGGV